MKENEKVITLRLSEEDHELLRKGAKADERSISSFIRKSTLDRAKQFVRGAE